MLRVGLTGGIGSGKSTVSVLLAERGAVVIDADQLAREVVAPGTPGLAAIVETFGSEVVATDGALDRQALGAMVFGDDTARRTLEEIIHPRVRARAGALEARAAPGAIVVHDIPLLVETGQHVTFDVVVVVDVPVRTQIDRLVSQRGMSSDEAETRIAAQATREQRTGAADLVVDNAGPRTELAERVDELWAELRARAG
ncbi:MAG: dephospho-CoA kinase [Nocardioidaceae bacterium]|jgi:dephospho-CoA kinase|nr:dephospho-CoA kinase [Nocardioidaceae bacterium]